MKITVIIVMFVLHCLTLQECHGRPILDEYGNHKQICVRFDQGESGVVWYLGYLHTTLHERDIDYATVILDKQLGIIQPQTSEKDFKKQCTPLEYDRGPFTVATIIEGRVEKFRGIASHHPWVDIRTRD